MMFDLIFLFTQKHTCKYSNMLLHCFTIISQQNASKHSSHNKQSYNSQQLKLYQQHDINVKLYYGTKYNLINM